jgi:DNA-binding transcriptional LysR family regulator
MEKAMKERVKEEVVIDSKRLFYFSKVFKRGSLNAVAEELDMAQAGIGRQIQLLEKELGVVLFERGTNGRGMVTGGHGRGMVPTEAAHLVHEYYLKNRDDQEKLKVALQEMHQMKRGNVKIITFAAYIDALMEEVLNDFHYSQPSLNTQIQEADASDKIISKVLDDDAEIGIVHTSPIIIPEVRCHTRVPLSINMLVNKDHPLVNKKRSFSLSEILAYPLLLPSAPFLKSQVKAQINKAIIIDSGIARKKAAIAGYGGALMTAFAARHEIQTGQLVALEIDHPDFTSMEACLIVRRGRILSPAANQLLRLITSKSSLFNLSYLA